MNTLDTVIDERDQVLNFIYWESYRRRRRFLINGRVNVEAVAEAIGVHPSTFGRLIVGTITTVSTHFYDGLLAFSGIPTKSELMTAIEDAKPRPSGAYLQERSDQEAATQPSRPDESPFPEQNGVS